MSRHGEALAALEFEQVLEVLRREIQSPLGAAEFARFAGDPIPSQVEEAQARLAEVGEAMQFLREAADVDAGPRRRERPSFLDLPDPTTALKRLPTRGAVLDAEEILDVAALMRRAMELRKLLMPPPGTAALLESYRLRLAHFGEALKSIDKKILPDGELSDDATPELGRIRRQLERQRSNIERALERFVAQKQAEGTLQEGYITVRDGRLAAPVKAAARGDAGGVIHGASGTGQTVYVEPLETIELNNELVRLTEERQRARHEALRAMTAELRQLLPDLREAAAVVARLEFLFALGQFGQEFVCCLPELGTSELELTHARHPLLIEQLRASGERPVPLGLKLGGEARLVLISGPNAGGKTLVLKTAGLLSLMAMAGLPVPADGARVPWFAHVLADIGDAQSIEASLSTFSAHVASLKRILEAAAADSLILLDELGAATDPDEGGALSIAIMEELLARQALGVISTHLPGPKIFAESAGGVANAAMGYDEATLSPTYAFLPGTPGRSAGLAMAARFGLPKAVIDGARAALSQNQKNIALFLERLHAQIAEAEAARARVVRAERDLRAREGRLQAEWAEMERTKLADLEKLITAAERKHAKEHTEALEALKRREATRRTIAEEEYQAAQRRKRQAREMRAAAAQALGHAAPEDDTPKPPPLHKGTHVRLKGYGGKGQIIRELGEGRWEVQLGTMKMNVETADIEPVDAPKEKKPAYKMPSGVKFTPAAREPRDLRELKLLGLRAEEARTQLERFLDDAYLAELDRVRIVHGHGKNVLRREVWSVLRDHPHISKYFHPEIQEGGAGATIAEFRE